MSTRRSSLLGRWIAARVCLPARFSHLALILNAFLWQYLFGKRMGRKKRGACGYLLPTEVHQFLLHSTCRTENPAEADFFFVPVYAACVMTKDRNTADETWSMQQNAAVVWRAYFFTPFFFFAPFFFFCPLGPLVLWSPGPLVPWSSGPVVLWSRGPLVFL